MKGFMTVNSSGSSRIYVTNAPANTQRVSQTAPVCRGCANCRPTPKAPTMTLAQAEAKLAALESEALRRRIASWCRPVLEGARGESVLD